MKSLSIQKVPTLKLMSYDISQVYFLEGRALLDSRYCIAATMRFLKSVVDFSSRQSFLVSSQYL